jgi:prepilin-type N-terminal cleavage/methylation domain-containing protein
MPPTRRLGFTLIELLIVITVLVLLVALVLVSVRYARMAAASAATRQRIEAALQAITRLGQIERGTATLALQTSIPTLGGTRLFARSETERPPAMVPQPGGTAWHRCFPHPDAVAPGHPTVAATGVGRPLVMAYPWGKNRLFEIREDWYAGPLGLPNPTSGPGPAPLTAAQVETWRKPEPHRLHELWPRASEAILLRAGIVPSPSDYRNDRRRRQPWNDAWGHPLVAAYAIFQPPECGLTTTATDGSRVYPRDRYLRGALEAYQFNRALYISIGGVGPVLSDTHLPGGFPTSADESAFADSCLGAWNQVCETTMADPAKVWDETSFLRPPWDGVLRVDGAQANSRFTCFISAPLEIK